MYFKGGGSVLKKYIYIKNVFAKPAIKTSHSSYFIARGKSKDTRGRSEGMLREKEFMDIKTKSLRGKWLLRPREGGMILKQAQMCSSYLPIPPSPLIILKKHIFKK